MNTLILRINSKTITQIFVGKNLTKDINSFVAKIKPTQTVYITDTNLVVKLKKYLAVKNENILVLKSGEKEKNTESLMKIVQFFMNKNIDRKSLVVAYGGGVITDIVGFGSSIYNRGIPVIFIPTTLLGQVDASIGGKNTINFNNIKNVLGTFYQPIAVFTDVENLKGLSDREFNSGMAEIIKSLLSFDKEFFCDLEKINEVDNNVLLGFIEKAVYIKKYLVEKDPYETKGLRKLINFGHTLGHALESERYLNINHGEGVAIGIHFSCFAAEDLGNITKQELQNVINILKLYKLPVFINFDIEKIIRKIKFDKKRSGEMIDFVTLKKIGKACVHKMKISELKKYLYKFKMLNEK